MFSIDDYVRKPRNNGQVLYVALPLKALALLTLIIVMVSKLETPEEWCLFKILSYGI